MNASSRRSLLLLLLLASCIDTAEDPPSDEPVTDDTVFFTTVAHVTEDGVVMDEPQPITAKDQRRMVEERRAHERGDSGWTASLDPGCASASFWLFDRTDYSGNQICFKGCGTAQMDKYFRWYRGLDGRLHTLGNWQIARGSYWPGSAPSAVWTVEPGPYTNNNFRWLPAWSAPAAFDVSSIGGHLNGIGVGFSYAGEACPGPNT